MVAVLVRFCGRLVVRDDLRCRWCVRAGGRDLEYRLLVVSDRFAEEPHRKPSQCHHPCRACRKCVWVWGLGRERERARDSTRRSMPWAEPPAITDLLAILHTRPDSVPSWYTPCPVQSRSRGVGVSCGSAWEARGGKLPLSFSEIHLTRRLESTATDSVGERTGSEARRLNHRGSLR